MKRDNSRAWRIAISAVCMTVVGSALAQIPVVGGPSNLGVAIGQTHAVAAEVKAAQPQEAGNPASGETANAAMLGELIRIDERLTELLQLEQEKFARSTKQ